MRRPRTPRCGDGGQTSTEFAGVVVAIALIVAVLASAGFGATIAEGIQTAICRILGGSCGGAAEASHIPTSCTTSSEARNVDAEITVASVTLDAGVTLTLTRTVDREGTTQWAVEEERSGGIGLAATAPGANVSLNGAGAGEELTGSISLTGSGGARYEFGSEQEARDFLTTATHQIAKDAAVGSNPITNVGPGRDAAMWLLDQVDGRSYDPPPPSETFIDGGLKVEGSADLKAGASGLELSGEAMAVVGARQDHVNGTTTWYYRTSSDVAGQLGLASGGVGTEVVVGIEYDDATGQARAASLSVSGELAGGLALTSPTSVTDLSDLTRSAGLDSQSGFYGTAELTLDLTQGSNRAVFADALHSVGLPILRGDGSADAPPPIEAVGALYGLFDGGAPGTTFGLVQYDHDETALDAEIGGGAGLKFGLGAGGGVTNRDVARAAYYEPGRGFVPWLQCSM